MVYSSSSSKGNSKSGNKSKAGIATTPEGIDLEFAKVTINTIRAKLVDREKHVKELEFQNSILIERVSAFEKAEKQTIYDRYFSKPTSNESPPVPPHRVHNPECQVSRCSSSTCCHRSNQHCCQPLPQCHRSPNVLGASSDSLVEISNTIEQLRIDIEFVKSKVIAVEALIPKKGRQVKATAEDEDEDQSYPESHNVAERTGIAGDDSIVSIDVHVPDLDNEQVPLNSKVNITEALVAHRFSVLTWNCENITNSIFELSRILSISKPSLVCLSELQIFQCNANHTFQYVTADYCWHLNSDDLYDSDLPLVQSRAYGGTAILWRRALDPYIEVVATSTSSFTPIVLKMPGIRTSVHISIYLPTHGKESEFVADLAELRNTLDELKDKFTDPIFYIRGDGNVNPNNKARVVLLEQLKADYSLKATDIGHTTYHHFVGNGSYDSMIDILLYSEGENITENVVTIHCVQEQSELLSHHDIIISTFTIPASHDPPALTTDLISAPRYAHTRYKVKWSEDGQARYASMVGPYLKEIRENWLLPESQISMSVLLSLTNNIMTRCAIDTNETIILAPKKVSKSRRFCKSIKTCRNKMKKAHKVFKIKSTFGSDSHFKTVFNARKKDYRDAIRKFKLQENIERFKELDDILEKPKDAFKYLKKCRESKEAKIERLTVGEKLYVGSAVCDGFYDSMTALKRCDIGLLKQDPCLSNQFLNYDQIIKISQGQQPIPPISREKSLKILKNIKKNVNDFFSITALHYINAGEEGIAHFTELLNAVIKEVDNASIEEMNIAHGNILYKGHKKNKNIDRSYRLISTCPFLAKAADFYLRDLYLEKWSNCQAQCQYQGAGSSHELASLLVTEVLQHSLHVANKPVFLLALDAESAFDRCLRQVLCCEMYKAGVPGTAILFMDNRLASRQTVYEWEGVMMGPAGDITGFEQGGVNSSDYYKLYNNSQLDTAHGAGLGSDIGSGVVAAVGQADDVILLSNEIHNLRLLVTLTEHYCQEYRVKLEPTKTKLLGYSMSKETDLLVKLAKSTNPITINNTKVQFAVEAEHVGILRHINGNMPNIIHRISAHKKALGSVLSAGLARGHRGSPAAALKVHQLYCTPVLFSGLASLVLSKCEVATIDCHYQKTLQYIQRLHDKTPRAAVLFLAGRLPGEAELHLRQLTLFTMICHLPGNPLHSHAEYSLTRLSSAAKSWFHQVKEICHQYGLPHPLKLLATPLPKVKFTKLARLKVTEYWHEVLTAEVLSLSSLRYLNPGTASLSHPHPVWTSSVGSSYECSKSTTLARWPVAAIGQK